MLAERDQDSQGESADFTLSNNCVTDRHLPDPWATVNDTAVEHGASTATTSVFA